MSRLAARPHDKELADAPRPAAELGPLLGSSAAALIVLGILALLAAEDIEPFGGSVSVLAGLLCGAGLVVAGLAGVTRRPTARLPHLPAASTPPLDARSSDGIDPPDDRAHRQRADETRIMRTVAAGPPPPSPEPTRAPSRTGTTQSRRGDHSPRGSRRSSVGTRA